jgi:hypothetical protein
MIHKCNNAARAATDLADHATCGRTQSIFRSLYRSCEPAHTIRAAQPAHAADAPAGALKIVDF